jgi:hypothetical protein
MAPPQTGQAGIPSAGGCGATALAALALAALALVALDRAALAPAVLAAGAVATAPRGGQTTPSHSRSLHLKSGALGFRLPSRLSHIGP